MLTFEGSFYSSFVKILYHKKALSEYLASFRREGKRIGLVPTMGALHAGHLSLLNYIKEYCDISVCSIFVNPTQFNDPEDLEKYPRPIQQDLKLLEEIGCDVVFIPAVEEMYGEGEEWTIELGRLDQVLEGALRPGHYQGVTQIVKKLFDVVKPDVACFGQKDYQQFLVVEKMVEIYSLDIDLIMCPTLREADGLAMSSRNVRLSPKGRQQALAIVKTLIGFQETYLDLGLGEARDQAIRKLTESEGLTLEYFEVCEPQTLRTVHSAEKGDQLGVLVAAWVDGVRLIDNIILGQSV
jgi:pantoate--beta-alanine ligase